MSQTIPQILDVTLRDGGYVNDWQFLIPDALAIVATLAKGGMPYIEVGYYHPPHSSTNGSDRFSGPSAYCQHEYLEAVSRVSGNSKLGVMVHLNEVQSTITYSLPIITFPSCASSCPVRTCNNSSRTLTRRTQPA